MGSVYRDVGSDAAGWWQDDLINQVLLLRHKHLELRMLLKLEIPVHWLLAFDSLQVMLLLLMVPTVAAKPLGGARGRDSSPFDLPFLLRFRLHTLQIECIYTTAGKRIVLKAQRLDLSLISANTVGDRQLSS